MDRRIRWAWWASVVLSTLGVMSIWLATMPRTVTMAADTASEPLAKGEFTVTISGPDTTKEGTDSRAFKAKITPLQSSPTYAWSWEAPEGAGNIPAVNFENADTAQTIVKTAHWFAIPDDDVAASHQSTYTISCTVTANGEEHVGSKQWVVFVPVATPEKPWGSVKDPKILITSLNVVQNTPPPNNLWRLGGIAGIQRNVPQPVYFLPAASQFTQKAHVHEERHVLQNTQGVGGIWKDTLWDAQKLYDNVLSKIQKATPQQVRDAVIAAVLEQNGADNITAKTLFQAAEEDAHRVSSDVEPWYLDWYEHTS